MSFAEDLRPILENARSIAGGFGLHPHQVEVLHGTWTGAAHTGDRSEALTTYTILEGGQNPKVAWLDDEQAALSAAGSKVEIGPLTPKHTVGGVELATLTGSALTTGQTLHVRITGPHHPSPGMRYVVTEVLANSALHYTIRCKPG